MEVAILEELLWSMKWGPVELNGIVRVKAIV